MLVRRKSACKTSAGSSKIFRWLAPLLGPNLDPKTGPKQRPKRRNENVIQFWTPFLGSIFGPKNGVSHRRISLLPANLQADLRTQQPEHECQHIPFSLLCVPRPLATVLETNWDARTHREKKHVLTLAIMLVRRKSACKNICGQQQNFLMAGPTFGSKSGPQKRGPSKDLKEGMKM